MRTYDDTQIFKEGLQVTTEELDSLKSLTEGKDYRYYDDTANGIYAFSFNHSQRNDEDFGMGIVNALNDLAEKKGDYGCWFLGDLDEEYVFVN